MSLLEQIESANSAFMAPTKDSVSQDDFKSMFISGGEKTPDEVLAENLYSRPSAKEWVPTTVWGNDLGRSGQIINAAGIGMVHGFTNTSRGLRQRYNQLVGDETPLDTLSQENEAIRYLQEDKDLGRHAVSGEIAGTLADPVAWLMGSEFVNILGTTKKAAVITGAVLGGSMYAEDNELSTLLNDALDTDFDPVAVNTAFGGVMSGALVSIINKFAGKKVSEEVVSEAVVNARIDPKIKEGILSSFEELMKQNPKPPVGKGVLVESAPDLVEGVERVNTEATQILKDQYKVTDELLQRVKSGELTQQEAAQIMYKNLFDPVEVAATVSPQAAKVVTEVADEVVGEDTRVLREVLDDFFIVPQKSKTDLGVIQREMETLFKNAPTEAQIEANRVAAQGEGLPDIKRVDSKGRPLTLPEMNKQVAGRNLELPEGSDPNYVLDTLRTARSNERMFAQEEMNRRIEAVNSSFLANVRSGVGDNLRAAIAKNRVRDGIIQSADDFELDPTVLANIPQEAQAALIKAVEGRSTIPQVHAALRASGFDFPIETVNLLVRGKRPWEPILKSMFRQPEFLPDEGMVLPSTVKGGTNYQGVIDANAMAASEANAVPSNLDQLIHQRNLNADVQRRLSVIRQRLAEKGEPTTLTANTPSTTSTTLGTVIGSQAGNIAPSMLSGLFGGAVGLEEAIRNEERDLKTIAAYGLTGFVSGVLLMKGAAKASDLKIKMVKRQSDKVLGAIETQFARLLYTGDTIQEASTNLNRIIPNLNTRIQAAEAGAGRQFNPPITNDEVEMLVRRDSMIVNGDNWNKWTEGLTDKLTPISTTIKQYAPKIWWDLMKMETNIKYESTKYATKAESAFKTINGLKTTQKDEVLRHLKLGNWDDASKVMRIASGDDSPITAIKEIIDDIGSRSVKAGLITPDSLIENYFPRVVTDYKGLSNTLNKVNLDKEKDAIDLAVEAYRDKNGIGNRELSPFEYTRIIHNVLRKSDNPALIMGANTRDRSLVKIIPSLEKFYAGAEESLYSYITRSVEDLNTARFFGKHIKPDADTSIPLVTDLKMIGEFLDENWKLNNRWVRNEVIGALRDRFAANHMTGWEIWKQLKSITNVAMLSNVGSTITQSGDILMAGYTQGSHVLGSLARALSGNRLTNAEAAGLVGNISEEFADIHKKPFWNWIQKKAFQVQGFAKLDKEGKSTHLDSALSRGFKLAETDEGINQLRKEYGAPLGREFKDLVTALKNKDSENELVRSYTFSELSRVQPVSRSEMPRYWLRSPNGRVLYQFKSFILKSMDLVRRDAYHEILKGNYAEGIKNLAGISLVLGIGGYGTSSINKFIYGMNQDKMEDMPLNGVKSIAKAFGYSPFVATQVQQGHAGDAALSYFLPSVSFVVNTIGKGYNAADAYLSDGTRKEKEKAFHEFMDTNGIFRQFDYWFGDRMIGSKLGAYKDKVKADREKRRKAEEQTKKRKELGLVRERRESR